MTSDAQKKAQQKYDKEHMKRYSVNMPIDVYNNMMSEVEKNKTNRNAYTIQSIKEKIEREK